MTMNRQVTLGDETITIQRFKGLKAILAIAAVTRLGREVPDIMAKAVRDYQERNQLEITEAMAALPRWSAFTKEDFDIAEKRSGKRVISLPAPMDANEQILTALPELLERARREVARLLATLIVPNSELREADKADTIEECLDGYYDRIMYDADLDELVDLILASVEVLQEQLGDKGDRLGKLVLVLWAKFRGWRSTPGNDSETQKTSTPESPNSSTPSLPPTDGTETPSSTESRGERSVA